MKLENYITSVLRWRWLVVAAMVLIMLALAAGARFVTVTNDYRILFRDDNPQLLAFNSLEDTYTASDRALIAIAPQTARYLPAKLLTRSKILQNPHGWRLTPVGLIP